MKSIGAFLVAVNSDIYVLEVRAVAVGARITPSSASVIDSPQDYVREANPNLPFKLYIYMSPPMPR